ncbi:MAG: C40 family peptidase [Acidimicrobiales bacterium]
MSVRTLQQQATALATQIQTDYAKLSVLDEGYNQAHLRVAQLGQQVRLVTKAIERAKTALGADKVHLRNIAVDAYVNAGSDSGFAILLSGGSKQIPMQQAYLGIASGNIGQAEALVTLESHKLAKSRGKLLTDEHAAKAAQHRIVVERALAEKVTARLESELSAVKGNLATAVATAEIQHARQLQAIAAAQAAALAKQQQGGSGLPGNPSPTPVVTGGGSGAVAVRAAESQLGVPYVWGGATPGVGFDCSGLTMWSWAQAGVSLAHGATEQYYEIAHVSMSNLQPGDLIFYGNASYLYHVVMYVGSGPYGSATVIQAETTGTNVMFSPIPPGAYGAGQP